MLKPIQCTQVLSCVQIIVIIMIKSVFFFCKQCLLRFFSFDLQYKLSRSVNKVWAQQEAEDQHVLTICFGDFEQTNLSTAGFSKVETHFHVDWLCGSITQEFSTWVGSLKQTFPSPENIITQIHLWAPSPSCCFENELCVTLEQYYLLISTVVPSPLLSPVSMKTGGIGSVGGVVESDEGDGLMLLWLPWHLSRAVIVFLEEWKNNVFV